MTIEEYDALRLELAQDAKFLTPTHCECPSCVAFLATLSREDILGFYVWEGLLGKRYRFYAFNELLTKVADYQSSVVNSTV